MNEKYNFFFRVFKINFFSRIEYKRRETSNVRKLKTKHNQSI